MTAAVASPRRLTAGCVALAAAILVGLPGATSAASHEDGLVATVELPEGEIDFELDVGRLHFLDAEGYPFAVAIIDGCAMNGHYWVFGAGLGTDAARMTIFDRTTGESHISVLPAYRLGEPIHTVVDPEALAVCREGPAGGLPPLTGVATLTSATEACRDSIDPIELYSEGHESAYRTLIRYGAGDEEVDRVIGDKPVVIVDDSDDWDEIILLTEGRTPRLVEGVILSGDEGMLPGRTRLTKAIRNISTSRVRRAFEWAKTGGIPDGLIDDLRLGQPTCIYHVSLEWETLGADAYLAQAGWIREGGRPLDPPRPVEARFAVEVGRADGSRTGLPISGPLAGTDLDGSLWEYENEDAKVVVLDGCALSGTFWAIAAAETAEPLELIITDTHSGATATRSLWTEREDVARLADTAILESCP